MFKLRTICIFLFLASIEISMSAKKPNLCGVDSDGEPIHECIGGYVYEDKDTDKTVEFVLGQKWNFVLYSLDINNKAEIVKATVKKLTKNKVSVHFICLEDHRFLLANTEGGYGLGQGIVDLEKIVDFIQLNELDVSGISIYIKPQAIENWSWEEPFYETEEILSRYVTISKNLKTLLVEKKADNLLLSGTIDYRIGELISESLSVEVKDFVNSKALDLVIVASYDTNIVKSAEAIEEKMKVFSDDVWTVAGVGLDQFKRKEASVNEAAAIVMEDSLDNPNFFGTAAYRNTFYPKWNGKEESGDDDGGKDVGGKDEGGKDNGRKDDIEEELDTEPDPIPDPNSPFGKYLVSKKHLYVWGYPDTKNFLRFIRDQRFKRVYIYIGCIQWDGENLVKGKLFSAGDSDIMELVPRIRKLGIKVELVMYVNDGVNNMKNYEKVEEVAKKLKELQKTLDFSILHFDQEPSSPGVYPQLLDMFERARRYVKVSTTLKPKWLYDKMADIQSEFNETYWEKFENCKTFADAIMTVVDSVDLMAYSSTYEGTRKLLDDFIVIKKRHPECEAKPAFELDPSDSLKTDSIYFSYIKDHDTFFKFANGVAEEFDGLTYHQYQVWNKDLYCEDTKRYASYHFGEPYDCQ